MKDLKLRVCLLWRWKKLKAKWIKADILKTQNELKVLSPSSASLRRRGKEGLAQAAPGLGKSQLQTRFTFLAKLSLATQKEGAAFKKKNYAPFFYSRNQRETSAASSTSNTQPRFFLFCCWIRNNCNRLVTMVVELDCFPEGQNVRGKEKAR